MTDHHPLTGTAGLCAIEDVRLAVYTGFARTGRAPGVPDLAAGTSLAPDLVRQALRRLHENRDIVLDPRDGGRVVMAHPFSAVPLGFSVMGARTLWWGGCAWDSFAVPHLLTGEPDVLVATRCPACDTPHAWVVGRDAPPRGGQVAHFLVPVRRAWDDVVRTCGNQRLFCSTGCVDAWLRRTGHERGHVMDLATLWRLARHWYAGRLDRGYVRRDPSSAAAYFAGVGLRGPFWGSSAAEDGPEASAG
ncbi:organomercurial lyase [Streptosporangium sp. NPDC023615]|uniref:organomercurial lyase n=1 Tax=Streptosporangium sp. NPDC023615 TaxID=3154794 RepID=UPI00341602DA